jgi:transcriptional regulator with XRE-family HTH domain
MSKPRPTPKPAPPPGGRRGPYQSPTLLKYLRQSSGLTWQEFARLAGVPKWLLVRWTNGQPIFSPKHRERLAEIARGLRELPSPEPAERRASILAAIEEHGTFPAPAAAQTPAQACAEQAAAAAVEPERAAGE